MEKQTQQQRLRDTRTAPLHTPTDLGEKATKNVSAALNLALADVFSLFLKTKNFHWHMSGLQFRDLHLLLDEQAEQIFAMTDKLAERVRKVGGITLHSIGQISHMQRISDNDADYVTPQDMISELLQDNRAFIASLRSAHDLCQEHRDIASAGMIEGWIQESESRAWYLFEISRQFHS